MMYWSNSLLDVLVVEDDVVVGVVEVAKLIMSAVMRVLRVVLLRRLH